MYGVRVLLKLDAYDRREKQRNGAGRSATQPHALDLLSEIAQMIAEGG